MSERRAEQDWKDIEILRKNMPQKTIIVSIIIIPKVPL